MLRVAITCSALVACGTTPADGHYQGEPALRLVGIVGGDTQQKLVAPSVGIEWVNFSNTASQTFYPDVAAIESTSLAGRFELDIFDLPDDGVISAFPSSTGAVDAEIGFGYLFGYDDTDRNGSWMLSSDGMNILPDKEIGLADAAVIYIKTAPAPDSEFAQTQIGTGEDDLFTSAAMLTPGFHLIHLRCGSDGVPMYKTLYEVVDNSTTVDMTLFLATVAPNKTPSPPDCLFVL